jgi:ABC-type spermidine/putrescine transport system permease subunit I
MLEILRKMDIVMPLELWGIAIGIILSYIIYIGFLIIINRK